LTLGTRVSTALKRILPIHIHTAKHRRFSVFQAAASDSQIQTFNLEDWAGMVRLTSCLGAGYLGCHASEFLRLGCSCVEGETSPCGELVVAWESRVGIGLQLDQYISEAGNLTYVIPVRVLDWYWLSCLLRDARILHSDCWAGQAILSSSRTGRKFF
jgi:hypothetical protein